MHEKSARMEAIEGHDHHGEATQMEANERTTPADERSAGEGVATANGEAAAAASAPPLSKNAQKKLLKAARMQELKPIKRQMERERKRQRRAEAREAGEPLPTRYKRAPPKEKRRMVKAALVIDLGFDELMTEKEISSMTSQMSLLYSSNRLSTRPFATIAFCGQGTVDPRSLLEENDSAEGQGDDGTARSAPATEQSTAEEVPMLESIIGVRMETKMLACWQRWKDVVLRNRGGVENLHLPQPGPSEESASAQDEATNASKNPRADRPLVKAKENIIYLTADTDTVLESIEEGHAYVIGGLVDRNRYKNICANKARRLGIRMARLPIPEDRLKTSQVMTVNQVVQILLAFNESEDWQVAIDRHLPVRKLRPQEDARDEAEDEDNSQGQTPTEDAQEAVTADVQGEGEDDIWEARENEAAEA